MSRYGRSGQTIKERLTRQVIDRARTGSTPDILKLKGMLDDEDSIIDALDVALKHLSSPLPDLDVADDVESQSVRQRTCLELLGTIALLADQRHHRNVVQRVNQHFRSSVHVELLCDWIRFCISDPAGRRSTPALCYPFHLVMTECATVVYALLNLEDFPDEAFVTSPSFIDFLIHLWMGPSTTSRKNGPRIMPLQEQVARSVNQCPAMLLLHLTLGDRDTGQVLQAELENRGRMHELPHTIASRARQLQTIQFLEVYPAKILLAAAKLLDSISYVTFTESLSRQAKQSRYLFEIAKAATGAVEHFPVYGSNETLAMAVQVFTRYMVDPDMNPTGVDGWCQLVAGGYLNILQLAMTNQVRLGRHEPLMPVFFGQLSGFATYPPLLKHLGRLAEKDMGSTGTGPLERAWETLWSQTIFPRCRLYSEWVYGAAPVTLNLCDNLLCVVPESGVAASKGCSGCRSVVYCSKECQRVDWARLHRSECHHFKKLYLGRSDGPNAPWYKPSWRTFHSQLLSQIVCSDPKIPDVWDPNTPYGRRHRTVSQVHGLDDVLPQVRFPATQPSVEFANLTDGAYWRVLYERSDPCFVPRLKDLVGAYRRGELPAGTRLCEGIFPITSSRYVSLTLVLRRAGGVWSPIKYTVWRVSSLRDGEYGGGRASS